MTSHVKETFDNVTSANVSTLQMEQNGNEALMEYSWKTVCMYQEKIVSIYNSTDGCRAQADDFNRKVVLVWMFCFMAMMMMMLATFIRQ